MNRRGMSRVRRAARVLGGALALAVLVVALDWAAGPPATALWALVAAVRTGTEVGSDVGSALVAAAGLFAWAFLGWFAAAVLFETGTAVPGSIGGISARLAGHGPRAARVTARWLIGITVATTPLVSLSATTMAEPAFAASPGVGGPVTPAILDRPVSTATAAVTPEPALQTRTPPVLDRPVAAPPTARPATPPSARSRPAADYVVRPGDTLWGIAARRLGSRANAAAVAEQWPRWYIANREVIGADPNLIRPGEALRAPPS